MPGPSPNEIRRMAFLAVVKDGKNIADAARAFGKSVAWGYRVVAEANICTKCRRPNDR